MLDGRLLTGARWAVTVCQGAHAFVEGRYRENVFGSRRACIALQVSVTGQRRELGGTRGANVGKLPSRAEGAAQGSRGEQPEPQ